jgi:hypothetical protein
LPALKTTHQNVGGPNHNKQLDNQATKTGSTSAKLSPTRGVSFAPQHQQQMLAAASAAIDPYQMMRQPLSSACGPVDFLRIHPNFSMKDAANLEREIANFNSGLPHNEELLQKACIIGATDFTKNIDGMRLIQDPNLASSLSIYGANAAAYGIPPAYLVQSQPGQQIGADGRPIENGRMTDKQAAQAMSPSLCSHYPIAMAPYMTANGPLFCASRYHPYHPYHTVQFQPQAYNGSLNPHNPSAPFKQTHTTSTSAPMPADKACCENTSQPDHNLRRLLTASQDPNQVTNQAKIHAAEALNIQQPHADGKEKMIAPAKTPERRPHSEPEPIKERDDKPAQSDNGSNKSTYIINNEDSFTGNTLVIHDRERELQGEEDKEVATKSKKSSSSRLPDETTNSSANQNADAHHRPSPPSSPPPKRVSFGLTKLKSLIKIPDGARNSPNTNGRAMSSYVDGANASSETLVNRLRAPVGVRQTVSRRSQAPASECPDISNGGAKTKSLPIPMDVDSSRRGNKSANNAGAQKNVQEASEGVSQRSSFGMAKTRTNTTQNSGKSLICDNENSSDGGCKRATDSQAPAGISSTTTSNGGRKSGPSNQQQKQAAQQPSPMQYNVLKCLTCKEPLEDRDFVQCPSVLSHKFCFACSKASIERQQLENKNLGNGLDRIFCPSGNRCFLATEPTSWTFMVST